MTGKIIRSSFSLALLVLMPAPCLFSGILYRYYEKQSFASLSQEALQIRQTLEYIAPDQIRSSDRVTLIASDGTVLYDSVAKATDMDNHLSREEVACALQEGTGTSSHYSSTVLKKNLYYALRLQNGTILRLSREQSSLGAMLLNMAWPIAVTVAGLLLLAAALSVRLARQITKPINSISPDAPQDVYPELQPLTRRLRQQKDTIRRQMDELSRRMLEFSAMTENMSEGLLVIDQETRVLSYNSAALKLLGCERPVEEGESVLALDREAGFRRCVEEALAGRRREELLERDGECRRVFASPVEQDGVQNRALIHICRCPRKQSCRSRL